MKITIADGAKQAQIFIDAKEFSGVRRVAKKVLEDLKLVTDRSYELTEGIPCAEEPCDCIIAGTVGKSLVIDMLAQEKRLDLSKVSGRREVYRFGIIKKDDNEKHNTLVIAGSDKRGTIYGLFHLSELLGVSPWVYFADVMPAKQDTVILTEKVNMVSKEPSVKYRGFFINDEWPSFGSWTFKHFGGFTAEMYDKVFELLLRLKGNYLWPAMWTSSFSLDGPGMANALLADEYGIVMSNSHHEPCLRHSEEWDLVKGADSIYGTAWNFDRNKEGLTRYWRDGLKRNGSLENIITMGMRGERDSEILGHTATLKENIEYLKEVITAQNQLIRECINENLDEVPRMLALYKEVEAYFYGDDNTPGLKDWQELDGVTFMLCEDNFGNMRTLPDKENRDRKGGWGMYYHFDYHGDPVSYEWVNSTHLSKVWEQMTQAYDFGVRDIWIVNVGDLEPQELPLSYFLDMAYDFDKWGTTAPNQTEAYTKKWLAMQFGSKLTDRELGKALQIVEGYTRLNSIRKPEALSPDTYHPVYYGEADWALSKAEEITALAEELKISVESTQDKMTYASFYELIYYPAAASMNQLRLMLYAGRNKLYAAQGRVLANQYADRMRACIQKDEELQAEYHRIAEGKWDGMMLSEHIGFVHWNDEECRYPVYHYIEPSKKPRMIVALKNDEQYSMGGDWTRKTLMVREPLDMGTDSVTLEIANGSGEPFPYRAECDAPWVGFSEKEGTVELQKELVLSIDRSKIPQENGEAVAKICIRTAFAHVDVELYAAKQKKIPKTFAIEACDYESKSEAYQILRPYGKYKAGAKAYPQTALFAPDSDAPYIHYRFMLDEEGVYEFDILTAPSNPTDTGNRLRLGVRLNDAPIQLIDTVRENYKGGDRSCAEWAKGVLDNVHTVTWKAAAKAGENHITLYACDPGVVIERIIVRQEGIQQPCGYIGILPK
ncbi:MAG: glycosyl hydrolase 115 family protein [Lachnospiraceae bacterium]|nr:glycosyl hydrolase 115 family protein [Lachnospiraceae bacterium]